MTSIGAGNELNRDGNGIERTRNEVDGSAGERLVPIGKFPKPQSNPQRRHPPKKTSGQAELDSGSNQRVDAVYKPWLLPPKHSFQLK